MESIIYNPYNGASVIVWLVSFLKDQVVLSDSVLSSSGYSRQRLSYDLQTHLSYPRIPYTRN